VEIGPADRAYLERARILGRNGWGHVHPNPMVGCVIVLEGRVVGEGFHRVFGGAHAEIVALAAAGDRARGATAYVSLEPCNHHGKTPPCAQALDRAGVRRVVFAATDPGDQPAGGASTLRAAGVEVDGPVWSADEGRSENPAFFHAATHGGLPWVALKLAMSLDERIALAPGVETRITGSEAVRRVHELRSGFDAVLVGSGTVRSDDPLLTVRLAPAGRVPPVRVVLASDGGLPPDAALLRDADGIPLHVFTGPEVPPSAVQRLEDRGARVHIVERGAEGLDLTRVLTTCSSLGIGSVLCEGGAKLTASLLRARLVDRLYLFIAPRTLGETALAAFPADAGAISAGELRPAGAPEVHGADILLVFDRHETRDGDD
jgi:diaminohydroxyphosphoribosylaminopyrimidine deaminase/5-amino-6-(5-phosphoribosylamino)uracil reductase